MADTKNLAENEELVNTVQKEVNTLVDRYKGQRQQIDDWNEIADYMYSCAQNRTIESKEKKKGMNMDADTRSNVGSTLFHRMVNQLASQLESVMWSKPDLWRYVTFSEDTEEATKDGEQRAKQQNLLSRYTIKRDEFLERLPYLTRMLFRRSNVFVRVDWIKELDTVTTKEPVYESAIDEAGELQSRIVREKDVSEEKIVENRPSVSFPPPWSIYLDRYVGDMQQQHCVAMVSQKSKADLKRGVDEGWYSEKQYEKLSENNLWDGQSETDAILSSDDARNSESPIYEQDNLYLVWDVYIDLPIDDSGEYDEEWEMVPEKYWLTFVGNKIGSAVCLRCERNPEPDDEIPIKDVHVYPDDGNTMYHTTIAEIMRSSYSADCTLENLALDNMGLVNDPPLTVVDGAHRVKDWTFKKGQVWPVFDHNAVERFEVRDNTQTTLLMKQNVEEQMMNALAIDKGLMGQSQGARTSASEASFINRNSMQPHLSQIRYILMQLLPWLGRKFMRYWQEYGLPDQVVQIADENKQYHRVSPTEAHGEFDVKVEIIDEYESDILKQQNLQNLLNIVASNEWLQKSRTEEVDGPALFKDIAKSMKLDPSNYIRGISSGDAERQAMEDVNLMLYQDTYVEVKPDMDFNTHMRVKQAQLTRWKGVEDEAIANGIRVDLLSQHVNELKEEMRGGSMAGGGAAPLPKQPAETPLAGPTEGTAQGQALAGEMGGMTR